jgi:hypothetical protein
MGFDFILTIMFFGIGLEMEKVITVTEKKSVRMFDVTISRSRNRKVSLVITKIGNEIYSMIDHNGEEVDKYDDEWYEFVEMLEEYLK